MRWSSFLPGIDSVEVAFEGIEVALPHAPVGLQPRVQSDERVWFEDVDAAHVKAYDGCGERRLDTLVSDTGAR